MYFILKNHFKTLQDSLTEWQMNLAVAGRFRRGSILDGHLLQGKKKQTHKQTNKEMDGIKISINRKVMDCGP